MEKIIKLSDQCNVITTEYYGGGKSHTIKCTGDKKSLKISITDHPKTISHLRSDLYKDSENETVSYSDGIIIHDISLTRKKEGNNVKSQLSSNKVISQVSGKGEYISSSLDLDRNDHIIVSSSIADKDIWLYKDGKIDGVEVE